MEYLILCVACSVTVSVLLKIAKRQSVVLEQAIAINYIMAITLSFFLLKPQFPTDMESLSVLPWGVFLALGVLLPSIFIVMGRAVEYAGIVKSDAAQRLSLILPIIAAVTIFGEEITEHRLLGVGLAFIALICLLARSETKQGKGGALAVLSLIGVWFGYGIIDILFKQLSKSGSAFPVSLVIAFGLGCLLMLLYITLIGQRWTIKSIIGGLILGVFNFFNILFYIKSHQAFAGNPTLVFAAVNIGVISLGTLTGAFVFKEKLRVINVIGLAFAIAAIVMLFYGQKII
ncbi:MAG: DMT family transporter [Gammaproteobacteria bacterium]|nr:DMT family transporter [Gammaproteobacteria bacterium]